MDDIAPPRFQRARFYQDFEGGFSAQARHAAGKTQFRLNGFRHGSSSELYLPQGRSGARQGPWYLRSHMAKYLITGVAGFIGSALARRLTEDGHSVRGIDNLITGKKENVAGVKGLDFRQTDILDPAAMADACSDIDFILHEAALGSVPRSVADPSTTNSNNVEGTLNVLSAARAESERSKKKVRVVFAASSSAYGDTPTLPKREDMFPNPMSPYAVTKLAGEFYNQAFWRVYGLETVSLRYFNIFGPRQDGESQ